MWSTRWLSGEESTCNAGHVGSIPGLGRSPGEGNGNPLQFSCPENPVDRAAKGLQRVGHYLSTKQQHMTPLVPGVLGPMMLLF